MGWLWLVDSLKIQVSFAKEPYKRDDILQKRPMILRSLLIVANPYHHTLSDTLPPHFVRDSSIHVALHHYTLPLDMGWLRLAISRLLKMIGL